MIYNYQRTIALGLLQNNQYSSVQKEGLLTIGMILLMDLPHYFENLAHDD